MLKKFLIGTLVVAGFAVMAASASADCSITTTLKVGSKGAEVSCLQTKVGATSDGSFGPMTKASVMAYQSNHGLSADGVVGPLSRVVLNGSPAAVTFAPAGCTSAGGYSPSLGLAGGLCHVASTPAAGCQAGFLFNPATGLSCTDAVSPTPGITTSGEGSATVTFDSTPLNSTTVNRGENKAVMGIKVKATGSDMKVTRLWLDIGTRIWLSADTVTLLDGSTVLATMPLTASTVTETTAGSAWQLQFNSLNFVVPVNTTKVLTVKVSRPTATAADTDVVVAITSSLRAVDMAGITDTYAFTTLGTRTWDLAAANAATGTLTTTLSASSPIAQSVSGLSATAGVTTDVKLMDFDLKATDGTVNVTEITGTITTVGTCTAAQCLASIELRDGTTVLDSVAGAGTFDFAEQTIAVVPGTTKTLSVWGKVNHVAGSYVVANDSLTAAVATVIGTSGTSYTAANGVGTPTGYAQHLFQYAPTFALVSTSATEDPESTSTTINKGGNYSIVFTVTAPAGSDMFIRTPFFATGTANVPTKTTFGIGGVLTASGTVSSAVSGTGKGTTLATWDKIIAGQTRTFTVTANIPHGGSAGYAGIEMSTNGINWSALESDATGIQQTWGISNFKTNPVQITAN